MGPRAPTTTVPASEQAVAASGAAGPLAVLHDDAGPLAVAVELLTPAPDGTPSGAAYYIAWGDGLSTTAVAPGRYEHRYASAGTYVVRLLGRAGPLWEASVTVTAPAANDLTGVSGNVSLDAYLSTGGGGSVRYGGQDGVVNGLTVGAEVTFVTPSKQLRLRSDDLNLDRPNLRFELQGAKADLALRFKDVPTDLHGSERRRDDTVTFNVRPDALPQFQFLYAGSRQSGADAYAVDVMRFGLSQRYKGLAPGLSELRWRADLQTTRSSVASATPGAPSQVTGGQSVTGQLDAQLSPGGDWELRPQLRATVRWDQSAGVPTESTQRYDASLAATHASESATLALALVVPNGGSAAGSNRQSLSVQTTRFAPFTVEADLARDQDASGSNGASSTRYGYGVGASAKLLEGLELGLGYRGRSGDGGVSNGAEVRLEAKLARQPLNLRLQAAGGVQFEQDGTVEPSADLSLGLRSELAGIDLGSQAALRLRSGLVSGTIEASANATMGDALELDASAGLLLATEPSTRADLELAYHLLPDLALRFHAEARARLADPPDTIATFGIGLRYAFGGQP